MINALGKYSVKVISDLSSGAPLLTPLYHLSGEGRMVSHSMTCSMRRMSNNGVCSFMTGPSLPLRDSFLQSPRTASYIEALIREGDKFDYSKWLQRVREREAQAKQGPTTFISEGLVAAEIGDQAGTLDGIWPKPKLMTRGVPIPRALRQTHRAAKSKALKINLRQRLGKVSDAWDEFQASRTRDAVYGFLGAVFEMSCTTRCGEGQPDFGDMHLNLRSSPSTGMRIHFQPSFAALVTTTPILRQSANGREHCGTSPNARNLEWR